ncbi:MAG: LeuA family protein [Desulfurivibrionaceae bacterium]
MKVIIDSTLREGEQTFGVVFSPGRKLEIIQRLCAIGIEEIELGIASRYDRIPEFLISRARASGVVGRLALWCRCLKEDIVIGAAAKPDLLSLSIPVSDLHIDKKLGKSRAWIIERVEKSIHSALELGVPLVSLGLEDATRADPEFLRKIIGLARRSGAGRIRLADTVGIAGPNQTAALVRELKGQFDIEIAVHMHNDFGMATANSIAAMDGGADWVDTTILGLGERAGNARLEEVAAYLCLRRRHHYNLSEIPALSRIVAETTGREIQPHQPIIGADIFACETGLHLQGLERDPATYEPFPPERVLAERVLRYGAKAGRREIGSSLGRPDRECPDHFLCEAPPPGT